MPSAGDDLRRVLLRVPEALSLDVAGRTDAGVLVPLYESDGEMHAVFTKRRDDLRRHPGEISFPGGRPEDEDRDLSETALREAEEEIGLDRACVELAGLSTPYRTAVTGYQIMPVVGFVSPDIKLTPNPDEVADIFETPFGFLMDPKNLEQQERETPAGDRRRFYAATWEGQYIWGATAGMLRALYDRLYGASLA
jgi:8-oxo-dGTP pyrophosphatase MutT (NUDIX family)